MEEPTPPTSSGPLWLQACLPGDASESPASLPTSPGPRPLERDGSRLAELATKPAGQGTVLSCSAVRALSLEKDVLIPSHPLPMAVGCLEAFGRQVSEIRAVVWSHPHGRAPPPLARAHPSITLSRTSLLASQPPSNGISGLTPLPAAHLPFYFGLTAGQGWDALAEPPAKRRAGTRRGEPPGFHREAIN